MSSASTAAIEILEVHDGGDRRLDHQVGDAGRIGGADHVVAVDLDFDVQLVIGEKHRRWMRRVALPAGQLARLGQSGGRAVLERHRQLAVDNLVTDRVGVRGAGERRRLVEKGACEGDHARAALGIVAAARLSRAVARNRIGAVERVVKAAPARIGRVQRIARVHHRNHELRSGDQRDFRIDILGGDLEGIALGQQIADLLEEGAMRLDVERLAAPRAEPRVDLALHRVATVEQPAIGRHQIAQDGFESGPEAIRRHAGAGKRLVADEAIQSRGDAQSARLN